MTSRPKVGQIWKEIEGDGVPPSARIRLRPAGTVGDGIQVLVGIDGLGHRHLCVPSPESDLGSQDRYSRGVTIEVRELHDGQGPRPYVDVECLMPALNELFAVVSEEMLDTLAVSPSKPFSVCHDVLERWRELLEKEKSPLLGREQLAALLAELLVLERLVRIRGTSVAGWVGPEKAVHDFMCGSVDLEVKSSLRTTGRIIEVHDLAQLDAPAGVALYVNFLRLRFAPQRGRSVPIVIDSILTNCADQRLLFDRLALAGYDPEQRAAYEASTFEVLEDLWYRIDDGFPRLTPRSFVDGGPPAAVTKVGYTLDLDATGSSPLDPASLGFLDQAANSFAP